MLHKFEKNLRQMGVSAVSLFLSSHQHSKVSYFNFLNERNYAEEKVFRHMRPTVPHLLEVPRLMGSFDLTRLPSTARNTFLFLGKERVAPGGASAKDAQQVLFLRANSFSKDSVAPNGAERIVLGALEEIERVFLDPRLAPELTATRLFVNVMPDVNMSQSAAISQYQRIMDKLVSKYATRLLKLRVDEIEVKMRVRDDHNPNVFVPVRLVASSANGGWLSRAAFRERLDRVTGATDLFYPLRWDAAKALYVESREQAVEEVNPWSNNRLLQKKRALARKAGSTYAPDMLTLLEVSLINQWQAHLDGASESAAMPENLFKVEELVLAKDSSLAEMSAEKLMAQTDK